MTQVDDRVHLEKSAMTMCFVRLLITFVIPAIFFIDIAPQLYAHENSTINNIEETQDLPENDTHDFRFTSFGFQTGIVLKDELDAGLGFG